MQELQVPGPLTASPALSPLSSVDLASIRPAAAKEREFSSSPGIPVKVPNQTVSEPHKYTNIVILASVLVDLYSS